MRVHESWSLTLAAWRLRLAAWGLGLVAHGSRSLGLEACDSLLVSRILVFRICDIGYPPVPAASTVFALVTLILRRAGFRFR